MSHEPFLLEVEPEPHNSSMVVVANVDQALLFTYRNDYKAYFYSETAIIGGAVGLIDAPFSGMATQVFFLRKAYSVGLGDWATRF